MKKGIAIMLAGLSLTMAPAAAAEPVKLTGDVSVTYERDTADGEPDNTGWISTFALKGEADLGADWVLYARLGGQKVSKPGFGDFNADYYGDDKKAVVSLDQFGFMRKGGKFTYKLGRQDATVGTSGLLYSRPDSNIGKKAFVDGLSVAGKAGVTEITVLMAREDNPSEDPKNKVYAIRAGYSPVANLTWGLTLGRYLAGADGSTNHWAVDGTYTFGKSSLTGEYAKSNTTADNNAYALILNYDFDGKTAASITNFRVENNAGMGGQSDFGQDLRGVHYGVTHTLRNNLALEVVYKKEKAISDGAKNTAFETTLSYSF
ncbi:MAG: hypothetical protein N2491_13235 [Negativicutes bacterium]|nr:hypothetical protein [Negativicutes bacterium]